jgi:hypothetical protein
MNESEELQYLRGKCSELEQGILDQRKQMSDLYDALTEILSDYDNAPNFLKRYRHVDIYDVQANEIRSLLARTKQED